nr:probable basic-leucine zipper transcription factor Q [Neodiprion pinetum]
MQRTPRTSRAERRAAGRVSSLEPAFPPVSPRLEAEVQPQPQLALLAELIQGNQDLLMRQIQQQQQHQQQLQLQQQEQQNLLHELLSQQRQQQEIVSQALIGILQGVQKLQERPQEFPIRPVPSPEVVEPPVAPSHPSVDFQSEFLAFLKSRGTTNVLPPQTRNSFGLNQVSVPAASIVELPSKQSNLKPGSYDGSSAWSLYERQFNMMSKVNGWSPSQKAANLTASLSGPALLKTAEDSWRNNASKRASSNPVWEAQPSVPQNSGN